MSEEPRDDGAELPAAGAPELLAPPPRRRSALRDPTIALLASVVAGWLLWDLWPDVAYFAGSPAPIDLGAAGAYHLDAARENRFVQIRGKLVETVSVSEGRSQRPRTVGRIAGTNLLVDKPGPPGGLDLFEGRLLPAGRREVYGEAVGVMARRGGTPLGDRWMVLRDGERPRRWGLSLTGAALLVLLLAVNAVVLLRHLLLSREPR